MFNQSSPIIQNMINTGQFGCQYPNSYNPYQNNMIPISQVNYNQPQNNGFIYKPVVDVNQYNGNYNPYSSNGFNQFDNGINQFGNPYANNRPSYDYYNPYGQNMNGYTNGYYGGITPSQYQKMLQGQNNVLKLKYSIAGACFNKQYTDSELERIVNPRARMQQMSKEELELQKEMHMLKQFEELFANPPLETIGMRTAQCIHDMSENMHKEFDSMSLREFLDDNLWKLQREQWLKENIKNRGRDLSRTYSSNDYNELLNMHRSSNPYINELLDNSKYDNNLDDMEIGLPGIMEMQRRRRQILEGKVPQFVSTDEAQRRRNEFTNQIMQQIYSKGGGHNV